MNIVLDFKSVLLFQLFYQIRNTGCNYDESFDQHLDSQSQENDSDTDEGEEYHHHKRSNRDHNYDYEKTNKVLRYSNYYDECNSCACNKCDDPPDCCKDVCKSCPQPLSQMSQIQMMAMSQMPQLSMPISPDSPMTLPQILQISLGQNSISEMQPQMQVPQMQIPQMQLPQMQIPEMQMPTPGLPYSFSDQGVIYFPLSSNCMSFLKNYSLLEPTVSKTPQINISSTVTAVSPKTMTTVTTATAKTPITTTFAAVATTKEQTEIYKTPLKQIENKDMFEAAIKNALSALSNNMRKIADKSSSHYNRYVLASALRRTKPVISNIDPSRFKILPIPNNMAESLMLQTRNAKGIRP